MENYKCQLSIDAPIQEVYAALTHQEKLKGWWTTRCEIHTQAGEESTFHFDKTSFVMKNEKLITNQEVLWKCVSHEFETEDPDTKTDEWIGTEIEFKIKENDKKWTDLSFEHKGMTPALECYKNCVSSWDHFLKTSLKHFVEARKGQPFLSK